MPFTTITRWLKDDKATKKAAGLRVHELESRLTPSASLVDINNSFLAAGNKPSNILGQSDNGRYIIFESQATDLITGQQDIPGTNDLFWKDLQTGDTRMVTALPPITDTGYDYANTRLSPTSFALQAVVDGAPIKPSFNKAVISGDGLYVGFSTVVNAARLDQDFATQTYLPSSPNTTATDLDNTLDVFRWESKSGLLELASRTTPSASTNKIATAFGRFGSADNPALSDSGTVVGFVSRVDAWYTSSAGKPSSFGVTTIVDAGNTQDVFVTSFDRSAGTATSVLSAQTFTNFGFFQNNFTRTFGHAAGGEGVQVDPNGRYLAVDQAGNISVAFAAPVNPQLGLGTGFGGILFPGLTQTVGNARTTNGFAEGYRTDVAAGFGSDITAVLVTATDGKITSTSGVTAGGGNVQNVVIARKTPSALLVSTSVGGFGSGNFNPAPQAPNPNRQDLYFVRTDINSQTAKVLNTQRLRASATSSTVADTTQYSLAPNGMYAVFAQVEGTKADGSEKSQIYFRQTLPSVASSNTLISVGTNGLPLSNGATFPQVSRNGRFVTFVSDTPANQIITGNPNDTNNANDVFIRDLWNTLNSKGQAVPKTFLLSYNSAGTGTSNGVSTRSFVGTTNEDPLNGVSPSTPNDAVGYSVFNSTGTNIDAGFPVLHGGTSIYDQPLPIGGLPPTVPPTDAPRTGVVSGGRDAGVSLITFSGAGTVTLGQRLTPYQGFTGEIRVASADVNGDGILDTIVAPGPGAGPRIIVYSGATDTRIFDFLGYESTFRGGVNVAAADINGDGKAEIILGADAGGGARVRVLDVFNNKTLADFFAYDVNFRGGVRVATGDFNGDGVQDVLTGAGTGGGPRVSAFDGASIAATGVLNRFIDFFAMELNLRNGVFVAGGDMNNDGIDDIIVGAGAGGAPRVRVFEATSVITRPGAPDLLYDFFAGNTGSRAGIRVAVKNVDGDITADIVTGEGLGRESRVRTFSGAKLAAPLTPTEIGNTFVVFNDLTSLNGAWVG